MSDGEIDGQLQTILLIFCLIELCSLFFGDQFERRWRRERSRVRMWLLAFRVDPPKIKTPQQEDRGL
jgi:hypothetical protein